MGDMILDVTVVKLAGLEAVEALEMWGRWQRQTEAKHRSPGLEGKFRSNRCSLCYEQEEPCDACKNSYQSAGQIDLKLVMAVERAISYGTMRTSLGGGRNRITNGCSDKEQTILLAHYRGLRSQEGGWMPSNPRALCRKIGVNINEYEPIVARLTQQVWNRAKKRLAY